MARETKAQREARLFQEQAVAEARLAQEYPARMMLALDRAVNSFNYELTVKEAQFVLTDRDAEYDWERAVSLSHSWDADSQYALESLERTLEDKAAARAERERRLAVKKEAERKVRELLNDEERELLGL